MFTAAHPRRVSDTYKDAAHQLGTLLGQNGHQLVYGGGRVGLMGIIADATLAAGGPVVGIIPEHIQVLEVEHTGLSELLVVDSMHTRKRMMVDRSDAFVVLPGGLGTLDETFEILTWKQLRLHDKPIVVANIDGYWDPLEGMTGYMITVRAAGTASCSPWSTGSRTCCGAVGPAGTGDQPRYQVAVRAAPCDATAGVSALLSSAASYGQWSVL